MLEKDLSKKLKRVLNPKRFRFVVILYESSLDIAKIKEFVSSEYVDALQTTLDLKSKSYTQLTEHLYCDNCFSYIDDFSVVLDNRELYSAFNQRRDKIAKYAMNLVVFYPKKLQTKLFVSASNLIPDIWEFRSAVLTLQSSEKEIKSIDVKEFGLQYEYSGMNQEEKQQEIARLEKRLENETLGEDEISTLLNNTARLYEEFGRYQKAKLLYQKALKINEKLLGEEHPDTASSYNNLASLYKSMGEYQKAELLYLKALKIGEKVLGEEHSNNATRYNNLAVLYEDMNEYQKAEPLHLKALKIRENLLGENHPDTASSYNNLASLYKSMGEYQKAELLYLKALKIGEKILGEEHSNNATRYNNLAVLYEDMNEYQKAEPLHLKALKIRENLLGENHPDTATSYNNLAHFYYALGEFEKAYGFMQRAVEVWSKVLPSNHPDLMSAKKGLEMIEGRL